MYLRQFVDDDLGCASYLIGDEEAGEAVLVDPAYAVEPFLDEAASRWPRDHARARDAYACRPRLGSRPARARARHARRRCTPTAGAAYPHDTLEDGDEIAVGSLAVKTLHTPGHRPEHCCFLAGDALLTGDSLFVGATARPDLAVDARDGAEGSSTACTACWSCPTT